MCQFSIKLLTKRRPQYKTLITTSRGALHVDRMFLTRNSRRDEVISASSATAKVSVDNDRPITVRY